MKYHFENYSIDPDKFELKKRDKLVAVEPQVFKLLKLLVENGDRMISKDDIVREIWNDRSISDASISSRIKLARVAVGDDGNKQNIIRTVHGQGFRFVAKVTIEATKVEPKPRTQVSLPSEATDTGLIGGHGSNKKPSIAVLPFQFLGNTGSNSFLADAIPHDLIQALSRLRWLFVIARGSAFRFRTSVHDPQVVGKTLGVKYLLTGSVENLDPKLNITIELSDTRSNEVIWGDQFISTHDDIHQIRMDIISKIASTLEVYIPLNEARNARLNVSENLDSWSNFHLGIQHMYRFTKKDNEKASGYFEQAILQDPRFARAHAGLSFTSFQSAFLKYSENPNESLQDARRFAERSVELDPIDPFANFTMGRYFMLQGDLERSTDWLDRAITLNPNYSQGHYSHGFTDLLSGQTQHSLPHVKKALALSPLDPFVYAMLAARSLSFVIDGEYELAAEAGEKAARAPGAHFIIDMIALIAFSLSDDTKKAQFWADNIRVRRPDANQDLFFASFPFSNNEIKQTISDALERYGF